MLYILFGENTFLRNRKLAEIVSAYRTKHPEALGFSEIDAQANDFRALEDALASQGLFDSLRMVVVRDGLLVWKEECVNALKRLGIFEDASRIIFLIEGDGIDKKTLEALGKNAKVQEFKMLSQQALRRWAAKQMDARFGKTIGQDALAMLIASARDLWHLSNLLEQIGLNTAERKTIAVVDVTLFVQRTESLAVFPAGDFVLAHKKEHALCELERLSAQGEDASALAAYVAWLIRSFAGVYAGAKERVPQEKIASVLSLHPFVVKKLSAAARAWDDASSRRLLDAAARLERRKTVSAIPQRLALDAFVLASS